MTKVKRLLYITAYPPDYKSGGQVFSCNAIKDLSKKYEIDLIFFDYPNQRPASDLPVKITKNFKPSLWNCMIRPQYFPIFTKRFSGKILRYLNQIAGQYDVLFFDHLQAAFYVKYVNHDFKAVRCHDIMVQRYARINKLVLPLVKLSEKSIRCFADKIFVPSKKDKWILKKEYSLDAQYTDEYIPDYQIPEISKTEGYIMFGRWDRNENLEGLDWFIKNVCPALGKNVTSKIAVMGEGLDKKFIRRYLVPYGIRYLGYVKNSHDEIIRRKAMIVPLFKGAGVKVKVLDSFAAGTPVIGTDIAFEGIPDIKGMVYRANRAESFIRQIRSNQEIQNTDKKENQKRFRKVYGLRHLSNFL